MLNYWNEERWDEWERACQRELRGMDVALLGEDAQLNEAVAKVRRREQLTWKLINL